MDWIVTIHNVVNEQCWQEIGKWERFRVEGCRSSMDASNIKREINSNRIVFVVIFKIVLNDEL